MVVPTLNMCTLYFVHILPLFHTGHESPESPQIDFFIDSGGFVRFHYFFFNRDVVRVSPDSDTMSLFRYDVVRIFG